MRGLRLKVRGSCKRRVTMVVGGKRRKQVQIATFRRGKKRLARDRRYPHRVRVERRRIGKKGKRVKLNVQVKTKDRGSGTFYRRVRLCRSR